MATNRQLTTRIPNGGFNRAFAPHVSQPEEFYDLQNLRPLVGKLEQTFVVGAGYTMTNLTGESTATAIHYMDIVRDGNAHLQYLVLNETNARYVDVSNTATQLLLPCVLQSAVPNNPTIFGQVLLYGVNATDFAAAGDYITVAIASATTFTWSRNGGAMSSPLTIQGSVNIGINGLKVAFMADTVYTGFTPGNTWVWTRYNTIPYSGAVTSTLYFPYDSTNYQTDVYLGGVGRNVLRVRDGFITSVGYTRMYAKYVAIFQGHLVCAHAARGIYSAINGVADPYNAATTPFTLTWSHLYDPDQLFPSLTNEADDYILPYTTYPDAVNFGITGMASFADRLIIYLPDAMYQMAYVGLPNVMQVLPYWQGVGSLFPSGLVETKRGHYFISRDNFYCFGGSSSGFGGLRPTPIGEPVREKFFAEIVPSTDSHYEKTFGYYDSYRQEIIWTYFVKNGAYYQEKEVVYSEKYNRWYFRTLPSADSGYTDITCQCRLYNTLGYFLYGAKGFVYKDGTTAGYTDVAGLTPSYAGCYAETNDLYYEQVYYRKEADSLYVDAALTGTTLAIQASARNFFSAAVTWTSATQAWTAALPEGKVGFPRPSVQGRVLRFNFTFVPVTTYVSGNSLSGWGDLVYAKGAER